MIVFRSVDLPAFGRPMMAMRSGFERSSSEPSSSSPRTSRALLFVFIRRQFGLGGKRFADRRIKFGEAIAMFGRKRHGVAKAEIIALDGAGFARAPFRLVGDEDQGLVGAPHEIGEEAVVGGQPGARIEDEEDRVGEFDRHFGLRPHAPGRDFADRLPRAPRCR